MKTETCCRCGKSFSWDDSAWFGGSPARGWRCLPICADCNREGKEQERHLERLEADKRRHKEQLEADERRESGRLANSTLRKEVTDQGTHTYSYKAESNADKWYLFEPKVMDAEKLIEEALSKSNLTDQNILSQKLFAQAESILNGVLRDSNFNIATYRVIVKLAKHSNQDHHRALAIKGLEPIVCRLMYPEHSREAAQLLRELGVSVSFRPWPVSSVIWAIFAVCFACFLIFRLSLGPTGIIVIMVITALVVYGLIPETRQRDGTELIHYDGKPFDKNGSSNTNDAPPSSFAEKNNHAEHDEWEAIRLDLERAGIQGNASISELRSAFERELFANNGVPVNRAVVRAAFYKSDPHIQSAIKDGTVKEICHEWQINNAISDEMFIRITNCAGYILVGLLDEKSSEKFFLPADLLVPKGYSLQALAASFREDVIRRCKNVISQRQRLAI